MRSKGKDMQLLGCFIGMIGIFLPSALLVLFFYPVWHNLKKYVVVYRALEGINAVVVGIMWAATFYLLKAVAIPNLQSISFINIAVILGTFSVLMFTKIRSTFIVMGCLLLSWIFQNNF